MSPSLPVTAAAYALGTFMCGSAAHAFAALSAADGQSQRAALLLGAAQALGYPDADDPPIDQRVDAGFFASARRDIGDAVWEQAQRSGEMLSFDEALVYARQAAGLEQTINDIIPPARLT